MKKIKKMTSKQLALKCAELALEKKAFNLTLMNVKPWLGLHDYVLVCSAQSFVQASAIAENIKKELKLQNICPLGIEGTQKGKWVLMDYQEVIVHIFHEYVREFYDLEGLWHSAPRVKIPKPKALKAKKTKNRKHA